MHVSSLAQLILLNNCVNVVCLLHSVVMLAHCIVYWAFLGGELVLRDLPLPLFDSVVWLDLNVGASSRLTIVGQVLRHSIVRIATLI